MELDQIIFKKVYAFIKKVRTPKTDPATQARTARLADLKPRLTVLARALTGDPVELFTAEREGGWSGLALFLPEYYNHASTLAGNTDFYLFRVCFLAVQRRLGLNWHDVATHPQEASRQQAAAAAPRVLETLLKELPAIHPLMEEVRATETRYQTDVTPGRPPDLSLLWGRWMSPQEVPGRSIPTPQDAPDAEPERPVPTTERQAPAREEMNVLDVDRQEIQDYTLMHSFEKVETIEEFKGNWRDLDGSDDLDEHAEALEELDLRDTIRADTPTHSVYQAEFFRMASAPESRNNTPSAGFWIPYDEWDGKKKAYRPGHCRVYPATLRSEDADYAVRTFMEHRSTLHTLRRRLALVHTELQQVRRQPSGEEPDLDAVVTAFCDFRAGHTPSENIYMTRRRQRPDLSVLLLLDASLSTDAYTGGRRILDVEKQSVLLFAQLLAEEDTRFRIDCFSSHTRNHCSYTTLKQFDEPWEKGKRRIGALHPQGYTRIGPALRHATALMSRETTRRRWILLLSDGKPNDYDRYEGSYGLADVRQALREAAGDNIHVHALAVDSDARYYLPLMLGHNGYRILPSPARLPEALAQLYVQMLR